MAEGTYEYECMRAELLGVEKPDYEEFMQKKMERDGALQEKIEAEEMRNTHELQEGLSGVAGRLNELNSIMRSTQKRINNLAAPISSFFKSKIGRSNNSKNNETYDTLESGAVTTQPSQSVKSKDPFDDSNLSTLDSLIDRCDRSQLSMEEQTKQMKRFK